MKYFVTIIFLLIVQFAVCQEQADTLISKSEVEKLKWEIYELKQANKKLEYDNYFSLNFYKRDTVYKSKDSVAVYFLTRKKKLIKQEIYLYDHFNGRKIDSVITLYNKIGLIELIEQWGRSGMAYDTPEDGMSTRVGPMDILELSRFKYDDKKRKILEVRNCFECGLYGSFNKTKIHYNKKGILTESIWEEIKGYDFWED